MFNAEMKRARKNNPFLPENMFYNAERDFYVCPYLRTPLFCIQNKRNIRTWLYFHKEPVYVKELFTLPSAWNVL